MGAATLPVPLTEAAGVALLLPLSEGASGEGVAAPLPLSAIEGLELSLAPTVPLAAPLPLPLPLGEPLALAPNEVVAVPLLLPPPELVPEPVRDVKGDTDGVLPAVGEGDEVELPLLPAEVVPPPAPLAVGELESAGVAVAGTAEGDAASHGEGVVPPLPLCRALLLPDAEGVAL